LENSSCSCDWSFFLFKKQLHIKPFSNSKVLIEKILFIMKNGITILFVILGMAFSSAQESENPEFTGENFSLEGALALFKKANSLEEFETMLNKEDNNINNLDLNDDGNTDYINVDDIKKNNTHVIVLSTFLGENDKQDIATIGIEKTGTTEATLQIEGDTDLYAENTIAEPSDIDQKIEKSKGGPDIGNIITTQLFVNVWFWPCVRYLYAPSYVVWVSPYRWNNHPRWWRPWRPFRYNLFYTRCAPHRIYFHRTPTRRLVYVRNVYTPRRHYSKVVVHHKTVVVRNNNPKTIVVKNSNRKVKAIKISRRGGGRRH
jgi:hypothetical protein